jgi:hypothetical protein
MRPSTYRQNGAVIQVTPTTQTDVKTITLPAGTSAFQIACETNACRVTLDGTDPTAAIGIVYPKDQIPVLVLVGNSGTTLKVVSNAPANSIVTVQPLA